MEIKSVANLDADKVYLSIDGIRYEEKGTRLIKGKKFKFYRVKPTKKEAEESVAKAKEIGFVDAARIIKHTSGAYLIFRYKDWSHVVPRVKSSKKTKRKSNGKS